MKSLITIRFAALIPALILIGCQGQHGFKRETNPTKDYQSAINESRPWQKNMPREAKQDPSINDQNVCPPPFTLAVPAAEGNRVLTFHEGSESDYIVNVLPQTNYPYTVSYDLPAGAKVREITRNRQYQITWRPGVGKTRITVATFNFTSPELQKRCGVSAPFSESVNLLVNPDDGAPVLTVTPPPATPIKFGDTFQFQIRIVDPAATKDQPPVWTDITSNVKSNAESTMRTLGAKEAVDCKREGTAVSDRTWVYDCAFTSSLIKNPPLDSGEAINAVFYIKGKSQRTGRPTADQDGFSTSVKVLFPAKRKEDVAPVKADPEHGVEVAKKDEPKAVATAPAATPASADDTGIKIKDESKLVPLPPARPTNLAVGKKK